MCTKTSQQAVFSSIHNSPQKALGFPCTLQLSVTLSVFSQQVNENKLDHCQTNAAFQGFFCREIEFLQSFM